MELHMQRLWEAQEIATQLRESVADQLLALQSMLVLNPVENFPFLEDLKVAAGPLHGLYSSDRSRSRAERIATDHQFAGRSAIAADSRKAYSAWAAALGGADATLRLLSGLHAHTTLFMSLGRPGQRVLLLPVEAGGHVSARPILERLGFDVLDMAVDVTGMCVDVEQTLAICESRRPDFVFVDRSEGLVVEDFSALTQVAEISIFDASQYLTHVITGDHPNPFSSGFDLIVSSVHKNFPGPQKAVLVTRAMTDEWAKLLNGLSTYVSNLHVASTYAAVLTLARTDWLASYSKRMLACATLLEEQLLHAGVPAVERPHDRIPTQHVWIRENSRERAFDTFEALEWCGILTNYRRLPYGLGHGLRLGVGGMVRVGLAETDIPQIADLIANIRRRGATDSARDAVRHLAEEIWDRECYW